MERCWAAYHDPTCLFQLAFTPVDRGESHRSRSANTSASDHGFAWRTPPAGFICSPPGGHGSFRRRPLEPRTPRDGVVSRARVERVRDRVQPELPERVEVDARPVRGLAPVRRREPRLLIGERNAPFLAVDSEGPATAPRGVTEPRGAEPRSEPVGVHVVRHVLVWRRLDGLHCERPAWLR